MADAALGKPPTLVELVWEHDLVFGGRSGDVHMTLDSASARALADAGARLRRWPAAWRWTSCTSSGRAGSTLKGLKADLTGPSRARRCRTASPPIDLHFTRHRRRARTIRSQRAIDLSRDKYCSVWHSLRQDIELDVTFKVTAAV